jgi:hypothetical protein
MNEATADAAAPAIVAAMSYGHGAKMPARAPPAATARTAIVPQSRRLASARLHMVVLPTLGKGCGEG